MRLLTGLLTNNRVLEDLDLAATNLEKEWLLTLCELLKDSRVKLQTLYLMFNPSIDLSTEKEAFTLVADSELDTVLHF